MGIIATWTFNVQVKLFLITKKQKRWLVVKLTTFKTNTYTGMNTFKVFIWSITKLDS